MTNEMDLKLDEWIIERWYHHRLEMAVLLLLLLGATVLVWPLAIVLLPLAIAEITACSEITTHYFRTTGGLFFKRQHKIAIAQVESLEFQNYGIPFLAEFGTLEIRTAAGDCIRSYFVPDPEAKIRLIIRLCDKRKLHTHSKRVEAVYQFNASVRGVV